MKFEIDFNIDVFFKCRKNELKYMKTYNVDAAKSFFRLGQIDMELQLCEFLLKQKGLIKY